PQGSGREMLLDLMQRANKVLAAAPTNKNRRSQNKVAATDIWLWGQGKAMTLPRMKDRFGISGSVISAVDLVRGIGILAGLQARIVPGATGYLGTNYKGKVAAALTALENEDFIFLHVEAPDETGHQGDVRKKIQAIEEFDKNVVGEFVKYQKSNNNLRLLVTPDHATPIAIKTHHAMPVPFAVCGAGINKGDFGSYSEESAKNSSSLYTGVTLFETFIRGEFKKT
ncbi:MAG: hypothetical protein PHC61_18640, partial [Chitinivibrionales bacterium]|nr:hypothetical protein [Chitinivibrionales bacterium]